MGYRVERDDITGTGGGSTDFVVQDTCVVDRPLVNGCEYRYRVFAFDRASNESGPSNEVVVVPRPSAPSTPTGLAAGDGDGGVLLTWARNPESDVVHYPIYRAIEPGFSPDEAIATCCDTAFTDTDVDDYTTYYYRISAVDTLELESGPTDEVWAVPHGMPAAPTAFRVEPGDTTATLLWNHVAPEAISHFNVFRDTIPMMHRIPYFADGFESYEVGLPPETPPWVVVQQNGTSIAVTESFAAAGAKSVALVDSSGYDYLRMLHSLSDTNCRAGWIEFWVRPGLMGEDDQLFQVEVLGEDGINHWAGVLELAREADDGSANFRSSLRLRHWVYLEDPETLAWCELGRWHRIVWKLDCGTDTYDVLLDGVAVVEDAPFYQDAEYLTILHGRTRAGPPSRMWLDDLLWSRWIEPVGAVPDSTFVDQGLEPGTTYFYQVAAVDTFGMEGFATTVVEVTTGSTAVVDAGNLERPSLALLGPNPSREGVALSYTVPVGGADVDFTVYDCSGRVVRSLAAGRIPGGIYDITWDSLDGGGRRVASGVYFIRLCVNDWSASRKVVIVR